MRPVRLGNLEACDDDATWRDQRAGDVRATSGRASDYYGPGGTLTGLGDYFWPRALAGKTAYSPYPLDAVHTYHYIPDVAAGLAALGCASDDVCGAWWMLPCRPAGTLRQLVSRLAAAAGRELPVAQLPRWAVKGMGLVAPIMHELAEMLYQWDEPFVIDDRRFRARFGIQPIDEWTAASDTVAWATAHYAAPR